MFRVIHLRLCGRFRVCLRLTRDYYEPIGRNLALPPIVLHQELPYTSPETCTVCCRGPARSRQTTVLAILLLPVTIVLNYRLSGRIATLEQMKML